MSGTLDRPRMGIAIWRYGRRPTPRSLPVNGPSKKTVLQRLRDELVGQLAATEQAVADARDGLVVGDDRAGSRGERGAVQERSWLFTAQAERLEDLRRKVYLIDKAEPVEQDTVSPGALVLVREEGGEDEAYLLHPELGGTEVDVDGVVVTVISPASPLGAVLVGTRAGDTVDVALPHGERTLLVVQVC